MQAQQAVANHTGERRIRRRIHETNGGGAGRRSGELQDRDRQCSEVGTARLKQLIDAKTVLIGHAAVPEFTAAADHAQYVALVNEDNAEHQRACAPYFGANGKFVKWLNTYRTEISEKLAGNQESDDAAIALQLAIMETTAGSYRSTGKVQAVRNYLFVVRRVYGIRQNDRSLDHDKK